MSALVDLRRAVVTSLESYVGTDLAKGRLYGVSMFEHGGEFDNVKELNRYAKKAPCVFVAILGVEGETKGGEPVATVSMGAFVLTVDKKKQEDDTPIREHGRRDAMALAIADALLDIILRFPTKSWGVAAGKPQNVSARNLYDEKFDALNAACWMVSWDQTVTLTTTPAPVLADLLELWIDYEVQDE